MRENVDGISKYQQEKEKGLGKSIKHLHMETDTCNKWTNQKQAIYSYIYIIKQNVKIKLKK